MKFESSTGVSEQIHSPSKFARCVSLLVLRFEPDILRNVERSNLRPSIGASQDDQVSTNCSGLEGVSSGGDVSSSLGELNIFPLQSHTRYMYSFQLRYHEIWHFIISSTLYLLNNFDKDIQISRALEKNVLRPHQGRTVNIVFRTGTAEKCFSFN